MAITFFGVASTPIIDPGTNTADPTAVIPPVLMAAGDLVIMIGTKRNASGSISMSETGGQTWLQFQASHLNSSTAVLAMNSFYCRYNGSWGANPSMSFGAATNNTVLMLVFRPSAAENTWAQDDVIKPSLNNYGAQSFTAPSTPFTVQYSLGTADTGYDSTVSVMIWATDDDNTWGTLTGTGWVKTSLGAQYRNTSGSDTSITAAYNIKTAIGALDISVGQNQATLGGDPGIKLLVVMYEITGVAAIPNKSYQIKQAVNRASTY